MGEEEWMRLNRPLKFNKNALEKRAKFMFHLFKGVSFLAYPAELQDRVQELR